MTESVLAPLGLDSSRFSLASAPPDRLARGVMWSYDGREFPAPTFPLGMAPAGSMVSSVRDLGRFLTLLAGGALPGVIDGEALAEMWRVQFPGDPEDPNPSGFGLGFHVGALEAGGEGDAPPPRHRPRGRDLRFLDRTRVPPPRRVSARWRSRMWISRTRSRPGSSGWRSGERSASGRAPPRRSRRSGTAPGGARRASRRPLPERGPAPGCGCWRAGDRALMEAGSATLELRAFGDCPARWSPTRASPSAPKSASWKKRPERGEPGGGAGPVRALRLAGRTFSRVPEPPPPPPEAAWLPLLGEYG